MSAAQELIVIPKESALTVFSEPQGLDPFMAKIRAEIDAFVPDISTAKGRKEIASIAHKVAKSKTYLDGVGKELVSELKELPKKVDASRKQMRDTLDAWKDEVRQPLTEWEQAETDRIEAHKQAIANLRSDCEDDIERTAAEIASAISLIEGVEIGPQWEEFETEAARAKDKALAELKVKLAAREKYEAEQAELARLRAEAEAREQKEREERIAREAAERAQRETEEKAQAEREAAIRREQEAKAAAERRELELKLQAEQAQREKVEAQQRAEQAERDAVERAERAAAAERQRQADEQARIEAEAKDREKNKEHKAKINRAALEAFVAGGMPEDCAKQAVTLIAKRSIPNITISY